MDRLIDRFLPAPDVQTVHAIRVRATPGRVLEVAEQFDLESLAVVRASSVCGGGCSEPGRSRLTCRAGSSTS